MPVHIQLTQGKVAQVDEIDIDLVAFRWYADRDGNTYYARRTAFIEGKKVAVRLHKVIASRIGIGGEVDHENRDGLDCRRENLRPATHSQNNANKGLGAANTSGVKGVSWHKRAGKWQAIVKIQGRQRHLGYFDDLDEARAVVEAERLKIFGEFACNG